jgi:hypothetical protein
VSSRCFPPSKTRPGRGEEDAPLHCIDDVGVKAQDQIGISDALEWDTPVLKVPKTHREHTGIASVTPAGDLVYWPFPGTMTAPKCIDVLEHLVGEAATKVIVCADRHPAHEAKAVEYWHGRGLPVEVRVGVSLFYTECCRPASCLILAKVLELPDAIFINQVVSQIAILGRVNHAVNPV